MKVKKPIVIIGTGRSGSTVFHDILSLHPEVAWITGLSSRFKKSSVLSRYFLNLVDFPVINKIIKKKIKPSEAYPFWEYYAKGFTFPFRDLTSKDLSEKTKKELITAFGNILTKKRNRLLLKLTGWPRLGYLKELFNDVKIIHIYRDGRAVANSLLNSDWWWRWGGPQNWRWNKLPPDLNDEWERYEYSFIALAAIEWKMLMDNIELTKSIIPKENYYEFKYEELCANPEDMLDKILEFAELEKMPKFFKNLKKYNLNSNNYKWEKELNVSQKAILNNILEKHLLKYKY